MLNRLVGVAVATVLAFAGLAAPAHAAEPAAVRILIVGDSVTHGTVGDWTWRYRLWQNLTAAGARVDFVGPHDGVLNPRTGDREDPRYADPVMGSGFDDDHAARWGMAFVTQEYPIGELVEEYQPDIVVEMLGTNDLAFYGATPEDVAASASEFVREARAAKPDVDVVLGQVVDRWISGAEVVNWWLGVIAADRDQPDARVVTTEAPEPWVQGEDTYDSLHPAAVGEVKIARSVAAALEELGVAADLGAFPDVANGPARAARAVVLWDRHGIPRPAWSLPAGAEGVRLWRRDVSAGGDWEQVDGARRYEDPQPGQVVRWRVQAFKGSAVSPLFSNEITIKLAPAPPILSGHPHW